MENMPSNVKKSTIDSMLSLFKGAIAYFVLYKIICLILTIAFFPFVYAFTYLSILLDKLSFIIFPLSNEEKELETYLIKKYIRPIQKEEKDVVKLEKQQAAIYNKTFREWKKSQQQIEYITNKGVNL